MKKFGFSKKNDDGDDANRSALFGNKKGSSAPQSENPYAQNMTPYQQARTGLPNGPRGGGGGLPSGPRGSGGYGAPSLNRTGSDASSATAPPPYSNQPAAGGYGNDRYGTASGYGDNKYASSSGYGGGASGAARPGGYGGMGRTNSDDTDAARNALFSGAQERQAQRQQGGPSGSGAYGSSGSGSGSGYGGYGEQRELTEEEKDHEAYRDTKRQIALDTGLSTYARLGAQNERLHHTDQLLDTATESHRHAEAQTKKLKSLNRSMFAVHVKNPFTEKRKTAEEEARIVNQNQSDRDIREASRRDKFQQNQRMEQNFAGFDKDDVPSSFTRGNQGDRSKYTLEDDSDEEGAAQLEAANEQIERDLEQMSIGVGKLKRIGQAMGDEIEHGDKLINRIGSKTDPLDDQIREDEHCRKRRKTKGNNSNVVKIGNKTFSLSAYLQPDDVPPKQQPKEQEKPDYVEHPAEEVNHDDSKQDTRQKRLHARPKKLDNERDTPMLKIRKALPIWAHQDEIKAGLRKDNDVLVIVGETGSGKSTQTPQFLCDEPWAQRKKVKIGNDMIGVGGIIAITQPRRVAATTLAGRVAKEMGTPLGHSKEGLVGYSVRFDHNVPKGTKVKFLTEGMLLQELLRDPNLRQYSAIIVDEIHERSVDVDLIAGFLKQILAGDKAGRGGVPLKVAIMSATADIDKIQGFFKPEDVKSEVQLLRIKGRQFPVDIKHTDQPVPDIQEALLKKIFDIHLQEPLPGDILAFLTGQEEIEAAQRLIEERSATLASGVPKLAVFPLYGQLSMQAQRDAFLPAKTKLTRKVVLSTNIAETSVTVPGVRYVIDCGKAKVKEFRSRLGMESLLAKAISKSSAIQRTGRAGREGPGKCFRLYPLWVYDTVLPDADLPEILRTDVLGAVLTLKARGINDIFSFPMMDFPDVEAAKAALVHLLILGALAEDGTITPIGRQLALFPVSAPYGRVLLAAAAPEADVLLEAIDVIACITSGENIFQQLQSEDAVREEVEETRKELYRREGDLLTYLTTMQRYASENADRMAWCRARRIHARNMKQALNIRRQLRGICVAQKLMAEQPPPDPQPFVPMSPERAELLLKCFLKGFATKTALLAPDSSYVTVQGKHVVAVHPSSAMHGQKKEAIMFLEHVFTQKNYAKKVSAVRADWIVQALGGE
ncbi:P-loop containing nucleoside triphosphate hydrolase protein [Xylariaceae sp. FL0016]|nr:P-loop containing nucleoside triphosphate hydrolase protein [Xylariaceae sp. FL0016]